MDGILRRVKTTRVLALGLLFASAHMTFAQERGGDAGSGLAYAQQACASCHAVRKGDRTSPNPLAPSFEATANTTGVTALSLATHLRSVHESMPSFTLSANAQDNVIAYILSLKHGT